MPMQALHSSPSPLLFSPFNHHQNRKFAFPHAVRLSRSSREVVGLASKRDRDGCDSGGGLVDEDMITLRKRIHEVKVAEDGLDLPPDWTEWEKQHYENYVDDVCEVVGLLQAFLMGTRPSLGVGLIALLLFSIPTSIFFISMHLIQAADSISSTLHLS